jgi:putative endopeptidase
MISLLDRDAPGFPWTVYFRSAGVSGDRRVILTNRTAISAFSRLFSSTPLRVLKSWAAFHLIDNAAPFLPRAFNEAHFEFHGRAVDGKQAPQPRWLDAIRLVSGGGWKDIESSRGAMGDAVGRLYVARWFDQGSREKLSLLVANLRNVMKDHIAKSDWMSPDTRAEALRKISSVRVEIGAPSHGDEYGQLTIRRDDLFGDVQRATELQWKSDLSRLEKPVDRSRWTITPQTVNAYNYAPFNEVVFTAALLQPPAFDPDQDSALTYGGIGAIIGHELSHGFDDVGRRYDASGRQRDWWRGNDAERFQSKADKLIELYSSCEAAPGLHVDGKLTLGENIADIGGLQLAFAAYHASLGKRAAPVIDGLTGDQRFFLGFALLRRGHRREDALRADVHNDPHTPDRCRVDEVVREVDGWYSAFGIAPSDASYIPPAERVRFW